MPRPKQTLVPSTSHLDIPITFDNSALLSASPSSSGSATATSSGTIEFQTHHQNGTTTTIQFITPDGFLTSAQQRIIAGTPVRGIKTSNAPGSSGSSGGYHFTTASGGHVIGGAVAGSSASAGSSGGFKHVRDIYVTPETTEATEALLLLGTGEQSPNTTPQGLLIVFGY